MENHQRLAVAMNVMLCLRLLVLAGPLNAQAQTPEYLHQLFESGKVFALRDAVQHADVPLFYRGAVEASLNKIAQAQTHLHKVIQSDPHSEEAYQAHDLLCNMYQRNGLYREALREAQAAFTERPNAKDLQNVMPYFQALARFPDMTVAKRRPSTVHRTSGDHSLPFKLNGKDDSFGFDTGAITSIMSDREAAHLGMTTQAVSTKMGDSSGNGVSGFRVAVANDLVIAGLHLKNVPFLVVPDTNEPFVEFPPDEYGRGLLGLPILIAMQTVRWQPKGDLDFGFHSEAATQLANLLFHGTNPIVQVTVQNRLLDFSLDTGAIDTDLNQVFAKELPALISSGQRETHTITGFGGTNNYESILLPSVALQVGGKDVTLAPAHIFVANGVGGGSMWAGNLGNDLLNQAHAITLDFRAMSLKLD
jgi:predicted aspartyl protease